MSQAKVDRYKQEKVNRKKNIAKNKMKVRLAKTVACLAVIAIVGFSGYTMYEHYEDSKPAETFQCDTTAIDDYLESVAK